MVERKRIFVAGDAATSLVDTWNLVKVRPTVEVKPRHVLRTTQLIDVDVAGTVNHARSVRNNLIVLVDRVGHD